MLSLLGRFVAALSEGAVEGLCRFAGFCIFHTSRGALARRNIRMALEVSDKQRVRRLAYEACCRAAELGLLGLAGQFFSPERWRRTISVSEELRAKLLEVGASERGLLFFVPHTTLMEALTALPLFFPENKKRISVLYRAFASEALEQAILKRRQKHGARLLSRDKGLRELVHELQRGQVGALLFDQNSGHKGGLISFMGRAASASDLGDVICKHADCATYVLALRRRGFWRGEIIAEELKPEQKGEGALAIAAHRWLERYLRDEATSTDWLWLHKRWKCLDTRKSRLGLNHKQIFEIPVQKKTKIFVRIPNWLGDVVMALPVLRALRASRPDAEITFFSKNIYLPLLQRFGLADRVLGIPRGDFKALRFFASLRDEAPDFTIALTNSLRGDLEMLATGCRQRAGLVREGYWRPLVNCGLRISRAELAQTHQSHVWEKMFISLGLTEKVSYEPFKISKDISSSTAAAPLGFVCGSANEPQKRYPAPLWHELAAKLNCPIRLIGSPAERGLCAEIAEGLPRVENYAGKTDMGTLVDALAECRAVIGNDTGAMHLSNALGVPTFVLYGPTSPTRTRPIFTSPYTQIKSVDGTMASIGVQNVVAAMGC